MKINLFKYSLEISVFFSGGIVMVYELLGSRILGPYLGTSIIVWTSLIGVILGSLSLGYYIGGKISDRATSYRQLSFFIFISGICVFLTYLLKDPLLSIFQDFTLDEKFKTVVVSTLLFSPASIILGIVSPYSVRLKIEHLKNSGTTVGNLYAISTLGSIFGTFLAGFYLIPSFGTNNLLIILSLSLLLISLLLFSKDLDKTKLFFLILMLVMLGVNYSFDKLPNKKVIDIDTLYNRVLVYEYKDNDTGKDIRGLRINNEYSSAMFLDGDDELVYQYTKYYDLIGYYNPNFKNALLIGGAAYSYPKHFLKKFPNAKIDVVEIDPGLTDVATKYFKLDTSNPRLGIFHTDGRVFLNNANRKYDVVYGDAFKSQWSIPWQLTTKESVKLTYDLLNDDGIVFLNIISSLNGPSSDFLKAEYATYKSVFPNVYLYPITTKDEKTVQNIILIAFKNDKNIEAKFSNANDLQLLSMKLDSVLNNGVVLTDDYAPVDYYAIKGL